MCHYSAKLQRAKQNLTTSKNLIEFTYGDFPCHLKVFSSTKCKKGKRLTITANLFMKVHQLDQFCPLKEPIRLQDLLNFKKR